MEELYAFAFISTLLAILFNKNFLWKCSVFSICFLIVINIIMGDF